MRYHIDLSERSYPHTHTYRYVPGDRERTVDIGGARGRYVRHLIKRDGATRRGRRP